MENFEEESLENTGGSSPETCIAWYCSGLGKSSGSSKNPRGDQKDHYTEMRLTVLGCCCSNPASAGFSFPKSPTNPNPSNRFPARSTSVATAGTEASDEPSSVALPLIRRRLILLRHAESTFVGSRVKDHERPLSKPGRRDAMSVAHKLEQMGWIPEVILSSDATRTKETLQILQETAIGFSEAEVYFIPSFYSVAAMDGQTAEHLQSAICEYSRDESLTVMCMGHNRGWEEAASMFSGASVELKTCNAALLEAAGKSWEEAFSTAGLGGWKLHGIVKPDSL